MARPPDDTRSLKGEFSAPAPAPHLLLRRGSREHPLYFSLALTSAGYQVACADHIREARHAMNCCDFKVARRQSFAAAALPLPPK